MMNESCNIVLNGRQLEDHEYAWKDGKLILHFPRPSAPARSFWSKAWLFVTGRWEEMRSPVFAAPDIVAVENWSIGIRKLLLSGTPEFDRKVAYVGDKNDRSQE